MSLPHHLRSHKEATKEESQREFFNVSKTEEGGLKGMEINCVLSIEGEAVHVSQIHPLASLKDGCMREEVGEVDDASISSSARSSLPSSSVAQAQLSSSQLHTR